MIEGVFVENVPFIEVLLAWNQVVQRAVFVLDTGFTGDLQVTPKLAKVLNLEVSGVTNTKIANGDIVKTPVALAVASMEGKESYVEVLISDSIPLAGISLLTKFAYKATVDCKHRTVMLEESL